VICAPSRSPASEGPEGRGVGDAGEGCGLAVVHAVAPRSQEVHMSCTSRHTHEQARGGRGGPCRPFCTPCCGGMLHACKHTHTYMHAHTRAHAHTHAQTRTHTHTHTRARACCQAQERGGCSSNLHETGKQSNSRRTRLMPTTSTPFNPPASEQQVPHGSSLPWTRPRTSSMNPLSCR